MSLTPPELAALGNQVFTRERTLDDIGSDYPISAFVAGLLDALTLIEERLEGISEAQLRFRIPGTPEGPDWNHDQVHFDSPELVTHLTTATKAWARSLVAGGAPVSEPEEVLPPTEEVTGASGPGFGYGGRRQLSLEETLNELRSTRDYLVRTFQQNAEALAEQWDQPYQNPTFGVLPLSHFVILMALHSAAHAFQLLEIQAHPDYPVA